MLNQRLPNMLIVAVIITILGTIKTWFFFSFDEKILSVLLGLFLIISGSKYFVSSQTYIKEFALCVLAILLSTRGNANAYIGSLLSLFPLAVFLLFRADVKIELMKVFNKTFAVITSISLLFWILYLNGVPLPHETTSYGNGRYYNYDNYYAFLLFRDLVNPLSIFPRFFSILIEPGDLGCIYVMLMFLDKFNFKHWYNKIYLIGLALTFSLAGYVLFLVALIPIIFKNSHSRWRNLIILVSAIALLMYFRSSSKDSMMYRIVGHRLEMNKETGTIAGYNRTEIAFNDFFNKQFWGSGNELFGYGNTLQYDGVDFKIFIARYGLLAAFAYVFFIFKCYRSRKSYYGLWYFILLFLVVYRGYSLMFYPGILILYIIGLDFLKEQERLELLNSKS